MRATRKSWFARILGGAPRAPGSPRAHPSLVHLAIFIVSYIASAGFGQRLPLIPGVTITFWPPAGIFLAALLLNPRPHGKWYVAAAALAELTCNAIWFHNTLPFAAIYFAANTLEAMTAAWLLDPRGTRPFKFDSPREVAKFVGLGACVAPVVGATVIATTDALLGKHAFTTAWPLVWMGDGTGLLVSTPIAFAVGRLWRERSLISASRLAEGFAAMSLLVGLGTAASRGMLPSEYVTIPVVLWMAVRFQLLGAAVAIAAVAITTALGTQHEASKVVSDGAALYPRVVLLQTYLGVTAVSALLGATLSHIHRKAEAELAAANRDLEQKVEERTQRLIRKRERLDVALRTGRMGVYEWNLKENTVWWSPEVYALHGVEPEAFELTVESAVSSVHPDDREELKAKSEDALARRAVFEHEYRVVLPDGGIRWLYNRSRVGLSTDGSSALITGVAVDVTERRHAEEQLRRNEAELREKTRFLEHIAAVTPGVLHIFDLVEQRAVFVNGSVAGLLGYSPQEILAMGAEVIPTLMHPEDRPHFELHLTKVRSLASGEVANFEFRMATRGGEWRWFHSSDTVFARDESGRARQLLGAAVEITERKLAEEQAKVSAARERERAEELNALFQSVPAAVWISTDPECRTMTGNPESYRFLHTPDGHNISATAPSEIAGERPFEEYRDGVRVDARDLPMQLAARTGKPVLNARLTLRYPNGTERHIFGNCSPLFGPDGSPRGSIGAFIDLTEFIEAETKLRAREQELATLAQNIPDILARFDRDLRHTFVGGGIERATGQAPEAFLGKSNRELGMPESLLRAWEPPLQQTFATGKPTTTEFEFPTPNGVRHFSSRLIPELGEDGVVRTVLSIIEDVTERKALETELSRHRDHLDALVRARTAELLNAQERLRRADRMAAVGTLAAGLTHDMNNILLPLSSRVDALLAMSGLPERVRADLAIVTALLEHLRALARNLSLFSQDPQHSGVEGRTDLTGWYGQVRHLIDASTGSNVSIEWDIPRGLPPVAVAPHRLTQAVQNLAQNARDAVLAKFGAQTSPEREGRIRIEAHIEDTNSEQVALRVTDNGEGMSDEVKRRCTEPFFTTKRDHIGDSASVGTGLGLSLATSIVESVGGRLLVESELGKGTSITLTLPVAAPHGAAVVSRLANVSIEDKRTRALVVETLRLLKYEVREGLPEPDSSSTLWVNDADPSVFEQAVRFLSADRTRRVVAIGGDQRWQSAGVVVCDATTPASQLRRMIVNHDERQAF